MAVRRERVVLDLEDHFTRKMAEAAAATAALKRELDGLGGTTRRTHEPMNRFERDVDSVARRMDHGGASIDRYSGRLATLGQAAAALGPSIIPVGAAAIPVVTTLANSFGFAALAGGSAMLAFQGVGDALKAMDDYGLDPSAANAEKLREAMAQLSPAAREFTRELSAMQPLLEQLQGSAASGLFPGLTKGLDAIVTRAPEVNRIVREVSDTLGGLLAEGGEALAGPGWDDFFESLESEARPALTDLAHGLGAVTHGFAELWQAFLPMDNEMSAGMVRLARDFDRWATSLDQTEGFQNFLDYVRETGPQVMDLFGSLGNMLVQLTQAAAPLGGPVLHALTSLADAIAAIADSDLGTPIMAIVTALSALRLAGRASAAVVPVFDRIGASYKTMSADAKTYLNFGAMTRKEMEGQAAAGRRLASSMVRGGAVAASMAASFGLFGDKVQQSNAATYALYGTMIAPGWGTAFGALIGGARDLGAAFTDNSGTMAHFQSKLAALKQAGDSAGLKKFADQMAMAADKMKDAGLAGTDEAKKLQALGYQARKAASSTDRFSKATQRAAQHQRDLSREARSTAQQFLAFGDKLDDSKVSLNQWIHQQEQAARALVEFGNNARRAADRGLKEGLIRQLEKAGPAGALRMRQLADATDAQIARANRAWASGRRAVRDYVDAVGRADGLGIDVNTRAAQQKLRRLHAQLAGLHNKQVTVTVAVNGASHAASVINQLPTLNRADGGTIPGPRFPYADKVLMLGAPGEEVISNRHGEADRFRADRAAGRIPAYADGGTVAGGPFFSADPIRAAVALEAFAATTTAATHAVFINATALATERKKLKKELDSTSSSLQRLGSASKELSSSLASAFRTDVFSSSFNPYGNSEVFAKLPYATQQQMLAAARANQAHNDAVQAQAFAADLAEAKRHGLRGPALHALAASNNLDAADYYASATRAQLRDLSRTFRARHQATQAAGQQVADLVYGKKIDHLTEVTKDLRSELREIKKATKESSTPHTRQDQADRNGRAFEAAMGGTAKSSKSKATVFAATRPGGRR